MLNWCLSMERDLEQVNGHSSDLDQRKWYSISEDSPQGEWDRIAEQMMLTFAESEHPFCRSTSTLWNHLLCLFNISHFSSTVCSQAMAKKTTTRFWRRTSHSKIETDDESYCQDAVARIVLDFSKPSEEKLRKSTSLEFNCERGEIGATW